MARKRMIKPDFWQSPKMAEMDHFTRLLFIGLWQVADDHGNGPMEPALLAAELFPFDLSRDTQHILTACSRGAQELAKRRLIRVYEVNGRDFYSVTNFSEHQKINRPSNPVYPLPDKGFYKDSTDTHNTLTEDAGNTQETLTLKLREEKLREEEVNTSDSAEPPETRREIGVIREDTEKLCQHLQTRIIELGSKEPRITKAWRDQARLLLDSDKRTEEEAHQLIDWALADGSFWQPHIQSMKKFREKYDTMRLQAQNPRGQGGGYMNSAEKKVAIAKAWLSRPSDDQPPADPWALPTTQTKEIGR